jgi:hypothetical protein
MATNKTLLPPPYLTLEDIDGDAIANGTVTFLDAGTAVLSVVYADADGAVVSANPLTVDAAGRYTVFLTPGQVVDVEYRDPLGALIKKVPGVQAVPGVAGNVDVFGVLGEAVNPGALVYLSDGSGGKTAGQWWLAGAGQVANISTLGMTLASGAALAAVTIRTAGRMTNLTGLVVGGKYYLAGAAGQISLVVTNNYRVVGQADTTTSLILAPNPFDTRLLVEGSVLTGTIAQLPLVGPSQTMALSPPGSPLTIQGIKAGYQGQRLRLLNTGGQQVDLLHQSAGAAAPDRLQNYVVSGPTSLVSGGYADYEYSTTTGYWRLVAHEQGGWITPPFVAGDYFGSGGMTWAVTSGQVARAAYYLRGKTMQLQVRVIGATIGGTLTALLARVLPAGFTSNGNSAGSYSATNGAVATAPLWAASANTVVFAPTTPSTTSWVAGPIWMAADMAIEVA